MAKKDKDKLEIKYVSIDEVKEYPKNPKLHNQPVIDGLVDRFGVRWPIMVQKGTNMIVAGHGRLKAFRNKGMKQIPVLVWDCSDEELQAFNVADNQSTIVGEWDEEQLAMNIEEMAEEFRGLLGFDEDDLEKILNSIAPDESEPKEKPDVEFATELLEEHQYVVFVFDNTLDWQTVKEQLSLKTVKEEQETETYSRRGLGRVLDGKVLLGLLE